MAIIQLNPHWPNDIRESIRGNRVLEKTSRQLMLRGGAKLDQDVIFEALKASQFYQDLIGDVIPAIFGFTPSQKAEAINQVHNLFLKATVQIDALPIRVLRVVRRKVITESMIRELNVTHSFADGSGQFTFFWMDILCHGLTPDNNTLGAPEIHALMKTDINPTDYAVGNWPTDFKRTNSRSGHAVMVKLPNARFRIIPQGNILQQIIDDAIENYETKLAKYIEDNFTGVI